MSKTLLGQIVDMKLKEEPCASCSVVETMRVWSNMLPEDAKCGIDEFYVRCPYTGAEFPWTRQAALLMLVEKDGEDG